MTTVEMRIIARLQSRDCWVARRSRSFSEDFYYPLMEDDNEDNPQENSWEEVLFPDKVWAAFPNNKKGIIMMTLQK